MTQNPFNIAPEDELLLLGGEPGPAHLLHLEERVATGTVAGKQDALSADRRHGFLYKAGVGHGRGLEDEVGVPLRHPDGIADVEVPSHVAKDDLRLGNSGRGFGDLEWQRELLVAAVEQGWHSQQGRVA